VPNKWRRGGLRSALYVVLGIVDGYIIVEALVMSCNCTNVVLDLPPHCDPHRESRTVCIDACIVGTIKSLWRWGINTHGCCCGHNRRPPSVVLAPHYGPVDVARIAKGLDEMDNRHWQVMQWQDGQLVDVETGEPIND
jgi:hypothetical protein